MKLDRVLGWLISLILLPLLIAAAQADSSGLSVTPASVTLTPGKDAELKIKNASGKVTVANSNSSVVSASLKEDKIKLTAQKKGSAILTLRDRKRSVRVTVVVQSASSDDSHSGDSHSGDSHSDDSSHTSPPVGMVVTPNNLVLIPGQNGVFTISGASGGTSMTNSNGDVASANLSGNTVQINAKAVGITFITIKDRTHVAVVQVTVQAPTNTGGGGGTSPIGGYTLLAWNDLGMHCMDGDFSVFSILPPYNNLHAQLVSNSSTQVVTQGVTLTYEAMADPDGSVNSTSINKSNFWQHVKSLFGADLAPDTGLTGNKTASFVPQPMAYNPADKMFVADGIPITPYDDAGKFNPYPMVKVLAHNANGDVLAQARVVLPVSDEMSCASCHASNSGPDARPQAGWVNQADPERDYKMNILRLHDEKQQGNASYSNALQVKGYAASGLMATVNQGKPILCASCHASNALPGTGVAGVKPLTEAIHGHHAMVRDASTRVLLDDINNRSACYQCHPGSSTKCLRGAMGDAVDAQGNATMDCQSCHGPMSKVGASGRVGWLDQPNCQACHHDGIREVSAVSNTGILRKWLDTRYATNPDVPGAGFSLYRMSKGHGGLQCEACHGATHAVYPSSHRNDNVLSIDVQGRSGTISECSSCHKSVPTTANGGPHGMHTIGSAWVSRHGSFAEGGATACAYCHGPDYRGGPLSTVKTARSFRADGKTVNFAAGQTVGCYDCHNGPRGD